MNNFRNFLLTAMLLGFQEIASADELFDFEPPKEFRTIMFPERENWPIREYVAPDIEKLEVIYDSKGIKVIFSTSLPPSTATRTVVVGLFLFLKKEEGWELVDSRRFEASGKYSGARAEATNSERAEPHISLLLSQGGRGHSYQQCASYKVEDKIFKLDLPLEKPAGAGRPAGAANGN